MGTKLGRAFNWRGMYNAEVGSLWLMLCSFGSLVLQISLESLSDLLYILNCHVNKQPVVVDLFFTGLWIAGNSC